MEKFIKKHSLETALLLSAVLIIIAKHLLK